ncbi:hypothetical protein OD800_09980 [Pseudomonas aeruginosa]|uniref:hypothetical protein n=1 Tax=Pseudomonas aeruginosa TaxID=287 RepID=UPI00071B462F|nr:hypothetical protein [Pseudomonas aeruginosa]EIU1683168.1 hypothetical protein [Pseudomonas aeruginosa]EKV4571144.1 hypothetical protein [Pseudomonas aeruginosa]KSD39856.1 hypothetical protein AO902_00030 [Pseudomonas aeruginosa]MBH8875528.1 hypothetical protein [Pseudomonas aeruginosa]MBU8393718.1 hypothetical protein [Pseudomonas aeruginosa]
MDDLRKPTRSAMPPHPHPILLLCLCLTLLGETDRSYSLADGAPATGISLQRDDRSPLQRLRDCERQGCSERQKIDPFTPDPDYLRAEGHVPLSW